MPESRSVRGSTTGRPIMVLLDALGKRWTLRIIWELREERLSFRALRARCDDMSPTSLNQRLKELKQLDLIDHQDGGYGLTPWGIELGEKLVDLNAWSKTWHSRETAP